MRLCILIGTYKHTCVYTECVRAHTTAAVVIARCQWPFIIVWDVDAAVEGAADEELGTLVKKLSFLSLRCSGSSSLALASSMSLLMAVMRASTRKRDERDAEKPSEKTQRVCAKCTKTRVMSE